MFSRAAVWLRTKTSCPGKFSKNTSREGNSVSKLGGERELLVLRQGGRVLQGADQRVVRVGPVEDLEGSDGRDPLMGSSVVRERNAGGKLRSPEIVLV